jgi:hypothetical protein
MELLVRSTEEPLAKNEFVTKLIKNTFPSN